MRKLKELESYAKFDNFAVTPRRIQLTDGEDGDFMWTTSPSTEQDCKYKGYRIQNVAIDGGYTFSVWSMLDGTEVREFYHCEIPMDIRCDIYEVKRWIDKHLPNLTARIEKAIADAIAEEQKRQERLKAERKKNADRFCGYSSSSYYKVRGEVSIKDDEATTELLTRFVLRTRRGGANLEEYARIIYNLHNMGALKMNVVKSKTK